jgi:PAS domain S-box-containing protein
LQLEAADGHPSLKGHLFWLLDRTGQVSFEEALEQQRVGRFMPVEGDEVALGFQPKSAVWIHFTLEREAAAPPLWWLAFPLDTLDHIDLYLERPDGTYEILHSGRALPFAQRESEWRSQAFKLNLATSEPRNVYLRVATIAAFRVPVWLWEEQAFEHFKARETFLFGGFFGIVFAAVLFSLFRALRYRSLSDLCYAIYVSGLEIANLIGNGFFQQFGLSDSLLVRIGLNACAFMLAGSVLVWFVVVLIDWPIVIARRLRVAASVMTALYVLTIAGIAVLAPSEIHRWPNLISPLLAVAGLGLGIWAAVRGWSGGRRVVWAFAPFILSVVYYQSSNLGLVHSSFLIDHALIRVTTLLHVQMLLSAILNRDADIRRKRDQELLEERNLLERRVEERTQALTQAVAFNETILLDSPLPMGVYAANGRCVMANEAYARLVGATREVLLTHDFTTSTAWQQSGLIDACRAALSQQCPRNLEVNVVSAYGKRVWCDCRILPTRINGLDHLLIQFIDLTERKQTEQRLQEAMAAAQTANRAKSECLASMSHEIRTPMNVIIGLSRLALELDPTPKLHDYLTKLQGAARGLLVILNDILDFSKVEAGRLELDSTAFLLPDVLQQVTDLFGERAREKGLALTLEVAPDVPTWLVGDPQRLGQVLTNLVGNAIKFTTSGAVCIQVKRLDDEPGLARLSFAVQDTGIGIGEEECRRLFEPFTQADGSITRRFGGTGLGLSISQRLVGLMGGEISVTSAPGQGSTFSFQIRLAVAEAGEEPPRVKATPLAVPATIRGARILLVDDYDLNLEVVQELLERLGFSVVAVENGEQALATLETEVFDVVLMDIHMPVMDGLETTRRIRQDGRFAALPVIAMSAAVLASDQAACAAAGMNDHIPKPVMPEQLLPVLERWLGSP